MWIAPAYCKRLNKMVPIIKEGTRDKGLEIHCKTLTRYLKPSDALPKLPRVPRQNAVVTKDNCFNVIKTTIETNDVVVLILESQHICIGNYEVFDDNYRLAISFKGESGTSSQWLFIKID